MNNYPYYYAWKNNSKRATMHKRHCLGGRSQGRQADGNSVRDICRVLVLPSRVVNGWLGCDNPEAAQQRVVHDPATPQG